MLRCWAVLALLVTLTGGRPPAEAGPSSGAIPLARAHAHNDYLHPRPLLDALDRGFTSVEVDVWLVQGALLVAHDRHETRPNRTLRSLYLEPLRRIVADRGGQVYPGFPVMLQLLVDVKSDAAATYEALHGELAAYAGMLTVVEEGTERPGAVRVVISGNRAPDRMARQRVRYAGVDGRLTDLAAHTAASLMPLVSDHWTRQFAWLGVGPMPEQERAALRRIVAEAHRRGRRIRFWATPDGPGPAREAVWTELLAAGVDYINTDDLDALRAFLLRYDPAPSRPR